jgi:hypothetical protein
MRNQNVLGKSLRLGKFKFEDNNTFGDLSAILIENMPIWKLQYASSKISLMSEWETKIAAIINETKK